MFIDTHCHLNMMIQHPRDTVMTSEQIVQIAPILNAAFDNGVTHVINVGTTYNETVNSVAIAQKYPNVYATAGIHPCDVKPSWKEDFSALKRLIKQHRSEIVAIGETGLDYYHQPYDKEAQIFLFHAHIQFAIEHEMPLVIHIRQAGDDALAILDQYKGETRGVVHCFSLDLEAAEQIKAWGNWYIGIDGPVTYPKNNWLRDVVTSVPLSLLLLETDAPFLPPQPFRGTQNSPIHIPLIAQAIAQARGCTCEEVAVQTTLNARVLFGLQEV